MNEDDEIDSLISDLVELGALVDNGVDAYGETTYTVNAERMREVYPAFYDLFMEEMNETLLSLYDQGLVNIEYDEDLNAHFSLTEEGEKEVERIILSDYPYDV